MSELARLFRTPTAEHHSATYPFISPARPELSTKGKTAIVTGAGSGIGLAIAQSLAKSGISHLGLVGRIEATLQRTAEIIQLLSPSTKISIHVTDVVDEASARTAFDAFVAGTVTKKIDILAANAGYLSELTSISKIDPADWWTGFEINVKGNFNVLRAYEQHAAPGGVVVHTATSAVYAPYMPGYSSYRGSKIAAIKVFEVFGSEMAEAGNGVRVVQFHPGLVRTATVAKIEESVKGIPWDDAGLSGDFFNWLVSDEAAFLSGKFVSANWDAEELLKNKHKIASDGRLYTISLVDGLSAVDGSSTLGGE